MNKICTSIEQSKKLIELGIDVNTTDMFYADLLVNNNHKYNLHPLESYGFKMFDETKLKTSEHLDFIPAWSLSALLKFIPKHIKNVNVLRIDIDEKDFSIWYDEIGCGVNIELPDITMDNPVDACVEMIIKLHELNLL